ncbi:hypothetical protein SAMN05421676_102181 [Salinibacillus kushneri]|uniref:Uncharacterized protein n=1 Tax=Salinibacillus kushneri TaxID=237682 RepID=A0A1I0AJY4_9BACI|nr:hypothetical protein SAMN05421676_102181 [Salinibacillus kushneri]
MTFLYWMIGILLTTWIGMAIVLFKTKLLDK